MNELLVNILSFAAAIVLASLFLWCGYLLGRAVVFDSRLSTRWIVRHPEGHTETADRDVLTIFDSEDRARAYVAVYSVSNKDRYRVEEVAVVPTGKGGSWRPPSWAQE